MMRALCWWIKAPTLTRYISALCPCLLVPAFHVQEKAQTGNSSPGPCSYAIPESTGKQSISKYTSLPSWGFGTAARWQTDKAQKSGTTTPGPGSYCI